MTWDDPTAWPGPFTDPQHASICVRVAGALDGLYDVSVRGPVKDEDGTPLDAFLIEAQADLYMVLVKKVEPEGNESERLFNSLQALSIRLSGRG